MPSTVTVWSTGANVALVASNSMVGQFKQVIDGLGSKWDNFATHTDRGRLCSLEIGVELTDDVAIWNIAGAAKFGPFECSHNLGDNRHTRLAVHASCMEPLVWYEAFVTKHSVIAFFVLGCVEFGVGVLLCHWLSTNHCEKLMPKT